MVQVSKKIYKSTLVSKNEAWLRYLYNEKIKSFEITSRNLAVVRKQVGLGENL